MRRRAAVAAAAAAAVALGATAAGAPATTQPTLVVRVEVSLTARSLSLSATRVRRGYYVEFGVRNTTAGRRVFSVAGRAVSVPARKLRLLVIMFDVRGRYRIVSRGSGTAIRSTFRVS